MLIHRFNILAATLTATALLIALPVQADETTSTTTTYVTPATTENTTVLTPSTEKHAIVTTTTPGTVVERRVIVTTVPAAKEVIVVPPNYSNCMPVQGWFGDVWVAKHNVCLYKGSDLGVVWVEAYWACSQYDTDYKCTKWDWISARWVY